MAEEQNETVQNPGAAAPAAGNDAAAEMTAPAEASVKDQDVPMTNAETQAVPAVSTLNAAAADTAPVPAQTTPTPVRNGVPPSESAPGTPTPVPAQAAPMPMPEKPVPHGAPVRQYLNQHVTAALLEGMKILAAQRPENPLQVLGQFLLDKSQENVKEVDAKA